MDVITAYRQVSSYRGAVEMCGVTHMTAIAYETAFRLHARKAHLWTG